MKKLQIFFAIILLISILISSMPYALAEEEIVDLEEKLVSITEEEKEIVQQLFIQLQEIEGLERDYALISEDIENLKIEVRDIESKIQDEEDKYDYNLNILEEVLKSYQRMGPASYLEIILESKDIPDFLRRINLIRDLSKNTGELLDSIEGTKEVLVEEKNNLDKKLSLIEERQRSLQDTLDQRTQLVREQEAYLKSLEADREYYEIYLDNLSESLVRLEELFSKLTAELAGIIENSHISLEELNPKLALQGIRLSISENLFNEIIGNHEDLPTIEFEFTRENISMFIDEYNIKLTGGFSIYQGHSIEFVIDEVIFYDFLLEEKTVKDLIGDGILFDFEKLLDGSSIKDIQIFDGYMELTIDVKFLSWGNQYDKLS